jgi:antitoxin component YwqK of YwqJK toxin-antitoxin module
MRVGFWMYHINDHIEEGDYLNGELDGKWVHRYSGGVKMFEGVFSFGQPEGVHKHWYADGTIKISGKYEGGAKHGKWRYFSQNGEIDYIYLFKHDKLWKVDGRRVVRNRDSSRP